jgi:hypothetical protein
LIEHRLEKSSKSIMAAKLFMVQLQLEFTFINKKKRDVLNLLTYKRGGDVRSIYIFGVDWVGPQ